MAAEAVLTNSTFLSRGRRPGAIVQLVGPDGSGKTTLAEALVVAVGPGRTLHRYWRPGLLRALHDFAGRPPAHTGAHGPQSVAPYGLTKSALRIAYYLTDFIVGHHMVYRPFARRGGMVIVERGFQDMVVDYRRYLLPSNRAVRVLARLVPRPDYIFILDAPASDIAARKDELEEGEIARQLVLWRSVARSRLGTVVLDVRRPVSALVSDIVAHVATEPGAA